MLGAIIGDIVGSRFEFNNHRSKDFELFTEECFFTDDTVMTLAIAKALQESKPDCSDLEENTVKYMQEIGRHYPNCGYGDRFFDWMFSDDPQPYGSFGNGAAMRVSACVDTIHQMNKEENGRLVQRVECVTAVSHNHPEGIKGAMAVVFATVFARAGRSKDEIKEFMDENFYKVDFTLDEIRDTYEFNPICQNTVPQALAAFYESTDFEDAIRNAISIGGDSDTLAAITGTIAEEYYGIPARLQQRALQYQGDRLLDIYEGYLEYLGVEFIDPETLADGKVLHEAKMEFLKDTTTQKLDRLCSVLRDSIVKVPGRAVLSVEDRKHFLEGIKAGVGATITSENEIIFEPEILVKDGKERYFPMFCNDDQVPEDYQQNFTIKDMTVWRCIELAKREEDLAGLVLDSFTEQMLIPMDMTPFIEKKESRVKIRDDHRILSSNGLFTLGRLTDEEFDEIVGNME